MDAAYLTHMPKRREILYRACFSLQYKLWWSGRVKASSQCSVIVSVGKQQYLISHNQIWSLSSIICTVAFFCMVFVPSDDLRGGCVKCWESIVVVSRGSGLDTSRHCARDTQDQCLGSIPQISATQDYCGHMFLAFMQLLVLLHPDCSPTAGLKYCSLS